MIREGKTHQIANMMQAGQASGMQTMDMALERLLKAGKISLEAALEKAQDKETMKSRAESFVNG
jgi:twitching motility protein PilT